MVKPLFFEKLIVLSVVFGSILCQNQANDARIHFVEDGGHGYSSPDRTGVEAQLYLAQRLSQIEDMDDFLNEIEIPEGVNLDDTGISNRFGGDERSNVEILKPAICMPELQPVCIRNSTSSIIYHPACVRVRRCGGCCGNSIFSCQPTNYTTRNVQVIATAINAVHVPGRGVELKPTFSAKEVEFVEEHTKCKCACIKKAEDCTDKQDYNPSTCTCNCKNVDERTKCLGNNETHAWSDETCACSCKGSYQCTTGNHYDHATCSCKEIKAGSRFMGVNRWENSPNYDSDPYYPGKRLTPAFTISENDPRRKHREDPE